MKKILFFLLISVGLNAQFNYQAIVKDSDGNLVTNNQVKFKFSLIYQSSTASPVYVEEHELVTPPDGVVNLSVGEGTVVNGTLSDIDWSQSVFMKEELDTGSGYQDMGTNRILAVPVAEFANKLDGFKIDNLNNILAGKSSMGQVSDTGSNNTAIGWRTLENNGGGSSNVAIGERSMMGGNQEIVYNTGNWNTAVGAATMIMNESGNENSAFGAGAMENSSSGSENVAIGYQALSSNSGGFMNTAVGSRAMHNRNTSGYWNTAVGTQSLKNNEIGNENVAIGAGAMYSPTGSNFTTAVGILAGNTPSSTLNTFIGYKATGFGEQTNSTAIGANAQITDSNMIQLGSVSVTLVNTSGKVSATSFKGNADEVTLTYSGTVTNVLAVINDLKSQIEFLKQQIGVASGVFLSSNGMTVECPYAPIGYVQELNGKTYTVVDDGLLLNYIAQYKDPLENPIDLSCLCTSQVTNSGEYLITLSRGSYNPDIRSWDTSNFLSMEEMFAFNPSFNRDIGIWDTSRVRNMSSMFEDSGFNQDIGEWDTSRVSNMESMFKMSDFNQDIGYWETSRVINMNYMFENSLFNQDIGYWNTSRVTSMLNMFADNVQFNQNLSGWCVSNFDSEPNYFSDNSTNFLDINKPVWGTCPP